MVNVLNPKLAVFFLAYLPQFVDPSSNVVGAQLLLLGAVFVVIGLITDGLYAVGASSLGSRIRPKTPLMRQRHRIAGATYVALGALALALPGSRTDSAAWPATTHH